MPHHLRSVHENKRDFVSSARRHILDSAAAFLQFGGSWTIGIAQDEIVGVEPEGDWLTGVVLDRQLCLNDDVAVTTPEYLPLEQPHHLPGDVGINAGGWLKLEFHRRWRPFDLKEKPVASG